jgi:hypothetical protein
MSSSFQDGSPTPEWVKALRRRQGIDVSRPEIVSGPHGLPSEAAEARNAQPSRPARLPSLRGPVRDYLKPEPWRIR